MTFTRNFIISLVMILIWAGCVIIFCHPILSKTAQ